MSKYIIEIDDNPVGGLFKAKGFNALVFDQEGLDRLQKYEEPVGKIKVWPKNGEHYYAIKDDMSIGCYVWGEDGECDLRRMATGNRFRTEEETEFAIERLKVLDDMKVFSEPLDVKWDGNTHHYCICYVYGIGSSYINVGWHATRRSGELYFESEEKAMECIRVVGEDRIKKYYLGVE